MADVIPIKASNDNGDEVKIPDLSFVRLIEALDDVTEDAPDDIERRIKIVKDFLVQIVAEEDHCDRMMLLTHLMHSVAVDIRELELEEDEVEILFETGLGTENEP